jgi:hypothetical protein
METVEGGHYTITLRPKEVPPEFLPAALAESDFVGAVADRSDRLQTAVPAKSEYRRSG